MTTQILITIGSILFAAAISYYFALRKGRKDAESKAEDNVLERIGELERQLGIVGAQVAPFNVAFQSMLVKQLTHFHTPENDRLLAKLGGVNVPPTITDEEEAELHVALQAIVDDPTIPADERDAAEMLPIQIRRVKREAEELAKGEAKLVDIQVVGRLDTGEQEK